MRQPLVSVAIPSHNRKAMLTRLIKSVQESTYKHVEIIVVDDCSTDGTAEVEQEFGDVIQYFRLTANRGVAAARNYALSKCNGQYILLIDDDNILSANCIEVLENQLASQDNVLMAGPVMRYLKAPDKIWWAGTKRNMTTSWTHFIHRNDIDQAPDVWDTDDFPNAWMLKKSVLRNTYFDESLYMHYEESDFAYRLKQSLQGNFIVVKDANVFHDVSFDDVDQIRRRWLDKQRVFYTGKNRAVFHKRYSRTLQRLAYLLFWNWVFTYFYIIFIMRLNLGGFGTNITIALTYLRGSIVGVFARS